MLIHKGQVALHVLLVHTVLMEVALQYVPMEVTLLLRETVLVQVVRQGIDVPGVQEQNALQGHTLQEEQVHVLTVQLGLMLTKHQVLQDVLTVLQEHIRELRLQVAQVVQPGLMLTRHQGLRDVTHVLRGLTPVLRLQVVPTV